MGSRKLLVAGFFVPLFFSWLHAQTAVRPGGGQSLPVAVSTTDTESLIEGTAAWSQIAVKHVAMNRTPPLYDTDEPAGLEVPTIDVRLVRTGGKLLVHLTWRDATEDVATLTPAPNTPPETRFRKVQTEAEDRFFDAAAVMFPEQVGAGAIAPSLQMGDADHPVEIYYWNAARGAMRMQAQGRGTTRRTGEIFPVRSLYQNGQWDVTMELPDLPTGTTLAFAVWNGSQKDRDGRKYFSVWQVLE
jgi:Ethylbenzene dehydrogenase